MRPLRESLGFDPGELSGAHVAGEIPLTAVLLNALIAQRLAASPSAVTAAVLEPHDGDACTAHVRLRASIVPSLEVRLQIEQQPELPDSPVLVLRWSMGGLGVLARMATPMLGMFDLLPPGVRVEGNLIGVDIAELLRARGYGELLPYLATLRVTTRPGRIVVKFEVRA